MHASIEGASYIPAASPRWLAVSRRLGRQSHPTLRNDAVFAPTSVDKIAAEELVEAMMTHEDRSPQPFWSIPRRRSAPRRRPRPPGRIIVEAAHGRMPGFVDTV